MLRLFTTGVHFITLQCGLHYITVCPALHYSVPCTTLQSALHCTTVCVGKVPIAWHCVHWEECLVWIIKYKCHMICNVYLQWSQQIVLCSKSLRQPTAFPTTTNYECETTNTKFIIPEEGINKSINNLQHILSFVDPTQILYLNVDNHIWFLTY